MTTSSAQISANQSNAQKSTSPITEIGKSQVANNAIKHGLFSKNLILADEDPFEYQTLLDQLQSELIPHGILEQTLIERIAVSLWRQKRLVRAETAYIDFETVSLTTLSLALIMSSISLIRRNHFPKRIWWNLIPIITNGISPLYQNMKYST
jgi:hypothetical protein